MSEATLSWSRLKQGATEPKVALAGIGKLSAWSEHRRDLGESSPAIVELRSALYSEQGISSFLDQREALVPEARCEVDHWLVWFRPGSLLLGRIVASADAFAREYVFVTAADVTGAPAALTLRRLLPHLDEFTRRCLELPTPEVVRAAFVSQQGALESVLAGELTPGEFLEVTPKERAAFASQPGLGPDGMPLSRLLYKVESEWVPYAPLTGGRAPKLKDAGVALRVPSVPAQVTSSVLLWDEFVTARIHRDVPRLYLLPATHDWLDLVVGPLQANHFSGLTSSRQRLLPETEVAHPITPALQAVAAGLLTAWRTGTSPATAPSEKSARPGSEDCKSAPVGPAPEVSSASATPPPPPPSPANSPAQISPSALVHAPPVAVPVPRPKDPRRRYQIVRACIIMALLLVVTGSAVFWGRGIWLEKQQLASVLADIGNNHLPKALEALKAADIRPKTRETLVSALKAPPALAKPMGLILVTEDVPAITLPLGPLQRPDDRPQFDHIRWTAVPIAPKDGVTVTVEPNPFAAGQGPTLKLAADRSAKPGDRDLVVTLSNALTNGAIPLKVRVAESPCNKALVAARQAETKTWDEALRLWNDAKTACGPVAEVTNGIVFAYAIVKVDEWLGQARGVMRTNWVAASNACAAAGKDLNAVTPLASGSPVRSSALHAHTNDCAALWQQMHQCATASAAATAAEQTNGWAAALKSWQAVQATCGPFTEAGNAINFAQAMANVGGVLDQARQAMSTNLATASERCVTASNQLAEVSTLGGTSTARANAWRQYTNLCASVQRDIANYQQCANALAQARQAETNSVADWQAVLANWQAVTNVCQPTPEVAHAIQFASTMTNVGAMLNQAKAWGGSTNTNDLSRATNVCGQALANLNAVRLLATNPGRSNAFAKCSEDAAQTRSVALAGLNKAACDAAKQWASAAEAQTNWPLALGWWEAAKRSCGATDQDVTNGITFAKGMTNIQALLTLAKGQTNSDPTSATQFCSRASTQLGVLKPLTNNQPERTRALTQLADETVALRIAANTEIDGRRKVADFCAKLELLMKIGKAENWTNLNAMLQAPESQAFAGESCFKSAQGWVRTNAPGLAPQNFTIYQLELFKVWFNVRPKKNVVDRGIPPKIPGTDRPAKPKEVSFWPSDDYIEACKRLGTDLSKAGLLTPEIKQEIKDIMSEMELRRILR